jgi:hypothetical protein
MKHQGPLVLRLTADRSLTGSNALIDSLLVVESVPVAVVLDLVESGCDGVEETIGKMSASVRD